MPVPVEQQGLKLEVPDQVYERLVRLLVKRVLEEEKMEQALRYNKTGVRKLEGKR